MLPVGFEPTGMILHNIIVLNVVIIIKELDASIFSFSFLGWFRVGSVCFGRICIILVRIKVRIYLFFIFLICDSIIIQLYWGLFWKKKQRENFIRFEPYPVFFTRERIRNAFILKIRSGFKSTHLGLLENPDQYIWVRDQYIKLIRIQLRTCCALMKENRSYRLKQIRFVTALDLIKCLK